MREDVSFCRICTAMCGIVVTTDGDRVVRVRGDADHPISQGYTCAKGRALPAFHHHPSRLDEPMVRGQQSGWDPALAGLAETVETAVAASGPDSIGMYLASGSAYDALGRRAAERLLSTLGSRQKYTATTVDTPSKPLVAQLVGGWTGLTPLWDHQQSKLLLLLGTNPVVSHGHSNALSDPVRAIRRQQERGSVWVADPRTTETARLADHHLQIRPGTDHHLLGWLVRELLLDGADDGYLAEHATGVDELGAAVASFRLPDVAERTAIPPTALKSLLTAIRTAGRVSAMTGTGVSMGAHANVTEWLLWALHIVTGSFDRPGGMWFNPGMLLQLDTRDGLQTPDAAAPGPASRPELPRRFGEFPCAGLIDEIEAGNLRVLFVVGGNPMIALPDPDRLAAAFRSLDALVVLDVVATDTTELASHVLPVAGQLERSDIPWMLDAYQLTRSTQYTQAMVAVGANRRPMWRVFGDLGARLGLDVVPPGATEESMLTRLLDQGTIEAAEVKATRSGVHLDDLLFGWVLDRVVPGRRWRLAPPALVDQLGELRASADTVLLPRRQLGTMNSQLRDVTGARCTVELAPSFGFVDGEHVEVASAFGAVIGVASLHDGLAPGTVSIPHGWSETNVGRLTSSSHGVDALTGMVCQSGVPVTVRSVDAPRRQQSEPPS